jgi:hypothetical protein
MGTLFSSAMTEASPVMDGIHFKSLSVCYRYIKIYLYIWVQSRPLLMIRAYTVIDRINKVPILIWIVIW